MSDEIMIVDDMMYDVQTINMTSPGINFIFPKDYCLAYQDMTSGNCGRHGTNVYPLSSVQWIPWGSSQGWECPKCKCIYSPLVKECGYCIAERLNEWKR